MVITPGQMRAAGRELRLRREGAVDQEANRAQSTRPFGAARNETLQRIAAGPTSSDIVGMKRELTLRDAGSANRLTRPTSARPFAAAQTTTLRTFVKRSKT